MCCFILGYVSHPLILYNSLPLGTALSKDLACTGFSPPRLSLTPSPAGQSSLISQSYPINFVLQSPQLSPPQCPLNASASQPRPLQGDSPDCSAFRQTPVTLTSSLNPCACDTLPTRQHEIFLGPHLNCSGWSYTPSQGLQGQTQHLSFPRMLD